MIEFARQEIADSEVSSIPPEEINVDIIKIKEDTSGYATVNVDQESLKRDRYQYDFRDIPKKQFPSKWKEFSQHEALEYLHAQPNIYKRGILHMDSASAYVKVNSGFEYIERGMKFFVTEIHLLRRTRGYTGRAFGGDDVVVEISHMAMDTGKLYGSVVAIMEHAFDPHQRYFICMVDKDCEDVGLLVPINPAIPKIRILTNRKNIRAGCVSIYQMKGGKQRFDRFQEVNMKTAQTLLFKVQYLQWRYDCYNPLGVAVDVIKNVCDSMDAGLRVLQIEHGVPSRYPKDVETQCVQDILSSEPNRQDLTDEFVFTIDPTDAKDIDDAISVKEVGKGLYKVGIHIADVAYFVSKGGAVDLEARKRAVSMYYWCQEEDKKVIHMLPETLSTDLCSFLPGKNRCALTVSFTMTDEGYIVEVDLPVRSIINSKKRLSYEEAEDLIKENSRDTETVSGKLNLLKSLIKRYRLLALGSQYHSCDPRYTHIAEAHAIVEELMIITNKEIAKFLLGKSKYSTTKFDCVPMRQQLPPSDLDVSKWMAKYEQVARNTFGLRRHFGKDKEVCSCFGECVCPQLHQTEEPAPKMKYMLVLQNAWSSTMKANLPLNFQHSKHVFGNMNNFPQQSLALIDMQNMKESADYVCSGYARNGELRHDDLNLDVYTHFTSPIRRYIDIIVHRLVLDKIDGKLPTYTMDEVRDICQHCTLNERNANHFEHETRRLKIAFNLKVSPINSNALVHRITDRGMKLYFYTEKHSEPTNKVLNLKYLELSKKPLVAELKQELFMSWHYRSYNALMNDEKSSKTSDVAESGKNEFNRAPFSY